MNDIPDHVYVDIDPENPTIIKVEVIKIIGQVKPNSQSSPGPIGNTQGLIVPKTSPNLNGNSAPPPKPQPKEEGWWDSWGSDVTHGALDVVGLFPVVGEIANGVGALVYLAEGDPVSAAFDAAAMWPAGGQAATAAKYAMKAEKAVAKKVAKEVTEAAIKKGEKELAEKAAKEAAEKKLKEEAAEKAAKPQGGNIEGSSKPKPKKPDGGFTADLSQSKAKTRGGHRNAGNKQLNDKMKTDPEFRKKMEDKHGSDVFDRTSTSPPGRRNPKNTEWDHNTNDANALDLRTVENHKIKTLSEGSKGGGWKRHWK